MGIGLEKIVADFNLCKLIPAGEFKYTAMVWRDDKINHYVHLNCRTSDDMGYKGESEEVNYFPAPTADEIMEKLDEPVLWRSDNGKWHCSCNCNVSTRNGKSASDCALWLWLWLKLKGIELK